MKIAIFTDTYFPQINGVVTSTRLLSKELEKRGHQVLIVGPRMPGALRSSNKVWRFRSVPFPFQKEYRLISPLSLKLRKFKEKGIDLIHIQTPFSMGHLGQYMSWKHDLPMVHTYHTFWAEYAHYLPFIPTRFKNLVSKVDNLLFSKNFCNRCHQIIAPSAQMKEKLLEYGVRIPINVIPTGIELEELKGSSDLSFRRNYQIGKNKKICIFVGRLGIEKNVYFLLDSFKMILKQSPDTVLFLAGDGPERENMIEYAQKIGVERNVIFAGYLTHNEVFKALHAADVVMFPSKTETQGLSLIEGFAMGCPAVGINAMGVAYVLENNMGGFLTEENLEQYTDKVLLLLNNEKIYKKKQKEALERAGYFSSASMGDKIERVYEKAIKLKKRLLRNKQNKESYFSGFFKGNM
ncbi:glycosyltransferase family 4 protein [Candidatus Margulisiibacteriota bacterium]